MRKTIPHILFYVFAVGLVAGASDEATIVLSSAMTQRRDVTTPGDVVKGVPDDGDWPGGEPPAYAIDDNIGTKYLHFKGDFDPDPSTGGAGIRIKPLDGPSIVTGLTLTTANDVPGRDPIAFELSGSNESIDGLYELIAEGDIVDFAGDEAWPRFTKNATPISFDNDVAYDHYQLIFPAIRGPVGGSVDSMQIAEVELLGQLTAPELVCLEELIGVDIGGSEPEGIVEPVAVCWRITAGGADIWGTADQFYYAYAPGPVLGDFTAIVAHKGTEPAGMHAWAKAGIMVRETLEPGSRHTMVVCTPENGVALQGRDVTDGGSWTQPVGLADWRIDEVDTVWLRLDRVGNTFIGSYAIGGETPPEVWTASVSHEGEFPYPDGLIPGLATTSHEQGTSIEVNYTDLCIGPYAGPPVLVDPDLPMLTGPDDGYMAIREVLDNGEIRDQGACYASLGSGAGTIVDFDADVLNIQDSGGNGHFANDDYFAVVEMGYRAPRAVDDLSLIARGTIRIPSGQGGFWTFGVNSDDGLTLQLPGQNFISAVNGEIVNFQRGAALRFFGGRAVADTLGLIELLPGDYPFWLTYHEGYSDAAVEFFAAKGVHTTFDPAIFRLVGHKSIGTVPIPGFYGEVTMAASRPGAGGQMDSLQDAMDAVAEGEAHGTNSVALVGIVNHSDPDDGAADPDVSGSFPADLVFPNDQPGNNDDFAVMVEGRLDIPVAGTYQIGFNSDDGAGIQIFGHTWSSIVADATGNAVITGDVGDWLINDSLTGWSFTAGEMEFPHAGRYEFRAIMFERSGGSFFELFGHGISPSTGRPDPIWHLLKTGGAGMVQDADGLQLVAPVGECEYFLPEDINSDCYVDFYDFAILASAWLGPVPEPDDLAFIVNPDIDLDSYVDPRDLALLASVWLECTDPANPRCIPSRELEFFEEVPAWRMPDPAVDSLTIEPDRADPGDSVILRATVHNRGTGSAQAAELVFLVDDVEIGREPVGPLEQPGAQTEVRITWAAEGPGRHWVLAQLELGEDTYDRSHSNNFQMAAVRVSGEADPQPELEVEIVDYDSLRLVAGESYEIPVIFRNPSFAPVFNVPVRFCIDDEVISGETIDYLAPGERREFKFRWSNVTRGEHRIKIDMDLPGEFPDADLQNVKVWPAIVPGVTVLYDTMEMDKWVSIGPQILKKGVQGLPTGSVGRIDGIAFHPYTPNIMYARGYNGAGLWKTTSTGTTWFPVGDKLESMDITSVAVDPKAPMNVYAGTRHHGIFKSTDGGNIWDTFAGKDITGNWVTELIIRSESAPTSPRVLVYAATNSGVLRYTSDDPWATTSNHGEWKNIKTGAITDLAVHPTVRSTVYASVENEGLYRTEKGITAKDETNEAPFGVHDWNKVGAKLPAISGWNGLKVDIYESYPSYVYAGVRKPKPGFHFAIYRSEDWGNTFELVKEYADDDETVKDIYNPFVRVSPVNKDLVYFAGIKLYKMSCTSKKEELVEGIHDDILGMEWDPWNDWQYYVCTDGGIWRCRVWPSGAKDLASNRNYDLRVTQFYDFDTSQTNPKLMIGGTQDCGTIMYEGSPDWKIIKGGDGLYSLIALNDQVFYAQHQWLEHTMRSDKGVNSWVNDWKPAHSGLPAGATWGWGKAFITIHPKFNDVLLSEGPEVHRSTDSGQNWYPHGPPSLGEKEYVHRVLFHPTRPGVIVAGTNKGDIWVLTYPYAWHKVFGGTGTGGVRSMAFSPVDADVLYVLYNSGELYARIRRFKLAFNPPNPPSVSDKIPIGGGLPNDRDLRVICGDGHDGNVVYVGTDKGVWRGKAPSPWSKWTWTDYNDGLPLVGVNDLLVDPTSKELRAATFGRGAWSVITGP